MLRPASRLIAVLLCAGALAGCATDDAKVADASKDKPAKTVTADTDKNAPTDLEGGIRQAQLARTAGHYDDAIHTLAQLMLVASDDPRVVSEYGKALAQAGRAKEATDFLNRAIELSSNDWTLYSALGVSYDQLGNQVAARTAYEHALALRPNEPSVLNNYALSRMLAGDSDGAHILIGRSQAAGGASDAKIAANIALINKLGPAKTENVAAAPKPVPVAPVAQNMPRPQQQMPQQQMQAPRPMAQNTPRPLPMPQQMPMQQQASMQPQSGGVVMQQVPLDPYAGPVAVKVARKPTASKTAADANVKPAQQPAKPANAKTAAALMPPAIVIDTKASKAKPADDMNAIPALRLTADARP